MTNQEVNKACADYIQKRMDIYKLNQSELARLSGVPQNRISRIVRNKNRISLLDFVKIGEVIYPDFIKEFYTKAGYDFKYYVNFVSQKSITNNDTFNPKSPLARLMLNPGCGTTQPSSPSHQLPQAPSFIQVLPQDESIPACRDSSYLLRFCELDGVWGSSSFSEYPNQIIRNIQLQCPMAQGIGVDGLC